jgi:hypothetical protein
MPNELVSIPTMTLNVVKPIAAITELSAAERLSFRASLVLMVSFRQANSTIIT